MSFFKNAEQTPLLLNNNNNNDEESQRSSKNRHTTPYGLFALIGLIISIILFISFIPRHTPDTPDEVLWPIDLTKNIFAHLRSLNEIANKSTRNSRSITDGFNASAEYVIGLLNKSTSCEIKKQYFKVPIWEKEMEAELNVTLDNGEIIIYQGGIDFWSMRYGGEAASLVSQNVTEVLNPCDDEDDEWDVEGKVALIQLGGKCSVWESAYKAEQSGATAVIFYNTRRKTKLSKTRVRKDDWKEGDPLMKIPVLAASYSLGQTLANVKDINITTHTKLFIVDTFNVLCYLNNHGNEENSIVIGSHLDSVPAGSGLVDNASGSSTTLEILLYLEKHRFRPKNRLIFAWWGAEEIGLMGSRHFVRELINSGEIENVAMNLNFDMLGSPNYIFYILQGSDAPDNARNGSVKIQHVLENHFHENRKHYEISNMLSGSDFLPFVQNGIPSGGLYTGSSEIKSRESQRKFGGIANAPLDPCYHQSCDTIENISTEAIRVTSRVIIKSIITFATRSNLKDFLSHKVTID